MRKDLQDWDWIWVLMDVGLEVVVIAVGNPPFPMLVLGRDAVNSDAGSDRVLRKHEINAEVMGKGSWHRRQGSACGKTESKCERRRWSGRCQARDAVSAIRLTTPGRKP